MTFKRVAAFILSVILVVAFVSCTSGGGLTKIADVKGLPDTPGDSDGAGRDDGEIEDESDTGSIILNTSSKKIHLSEECTYAKNMKGENKSVEPISKKSEYLADGYSVCSNCEKKYSDGN